MDFFAKGLEKIEYALGLVTRPIERFCHHYLLAANRWLLGKIDPLSHAIEGTLLKKILQVTIFPCFIILTLIIGFKLVEHGIHARYTFTATVITLLLMGIIFAPLERLIPFSRRWLHDQDEPTDVFLFFGNHAIERYIGVPLQVAATAVLVQKIAPYISQDLWPSHWPALVQIFLWLAARDFIRYWYHRWQHQNEFMWRWHAVHHSSKRLYWFNGFRVHPLEDLVGILWGFPLAFVNVPPEIVFITGLLATTISRFQHTNMDLILGPLDYIFSSPNNHRYHHSKNITESNSNYGGEVVIWDHLFGTFHLPKGQKPSDDIGIGDMPNYPQDWNGLMLAPFRYKNLKDNAQKMNVIRKDEAVNIAIVDTQNATKSIE